MNTTRRTTLPFATAMFGTFGMFSMLGVLGCEAPTPDDAEAILRDTTSQACPADRQIARTPASMSSCPEVAGWTRQAVFPGAAEGSELASFCGYATSGEPTSAQIAALANAGFVDYAPDCEVVFEQVDAMSVLGPILRTLFREGIRRPEASELDLPAAAASRARVGVAVVDSWPDAGYVPRSKHGPTMKAIISDIACPKAASPYVCSVIIDGRLALTRHDGGLIDLQRGGYYGTMAELAASIYLAVDAWTDAVPSQDASRLVINLSIGWDSDFGDFGDRPSVDAVHTALEYAACKGALVIVAAGNGGDEGCDQGPLLPGGWEEHSAPTMAECVAIGAGTMVAKGSGYRPLVYSVGGLDFDHDEDMPNSRPGGRPRLVAQATHAVVGENTLSTAMTGTSVSAAVVSGAAALVWSVNPTLRADEVMAILYEKGETTPLFADYFGSGVGSTAVHGIDVCAAVDEACDPLAGCTLPQPLGCLSRAPTVDLSDIFDVPLNLGSLSTPSFVESEEPCTVSCGDGLSSSHVVFRAAGADEACPEVDPNLRFTEPQPTQVACPNCKITSSGILEASLDPAFDPPDYSILAVDVTLDGDTGPTTYRLGAVELNSWTITQVQLPLTQPINRGSISIQFDTRRPVSNPLIIE